MYPRLPINNDVKTLLDPKNYEKHSKPTA